MLGLVAGGGQFPRLVADGAKKQGLPVFAVAFENETSPDISSSVDKVLWIKLGQLGRLIKYFLNNKVTHVVFAGPVNKPRAFDIRPDLRAIKLLLSLKSRNDNSLLSAVADELSAENFKVVSGIKFVPDIVSPQGFVSKRKPSANELEDILFGWPLIKKIGAMDIGQCIVVRDRAVVAVEAIEGTDSTIVRAGNLVGRNFCVIKTFKPGQDERIDLPALGLETINTMVKSGASCLAYEAGVSLFFDLAEAIKVADKNRIAIVGINPGQSVEAQLQGRQ